MNQETIALWVQLAAVVAAVGASIVALVVSALDRRNARQIAAADRKEALHQAHLMFEMELLTRLTQNLRRAGHSDSTISKDMGAEAASLIGAIGPERLPRNWRSRVGDFSIPDLHRELQDESKPEWIRNSIEAQIALAQVTEEVHRAVSRPAE
ncbi:hypothetical protein LJ756_13125 [Arthrobacter sp. zg-Y411]|uniref:hypothetical protein n=1 Tax=Arthrobacter zhangbolii TaxID=2886936 RepID=UPI001D158DEE|nr:hypothetical protein [Arthrobacter zhangbolii]MCC3295562.1 hypothetical protein [Arthrobacter zhangbolii]